tara:strand:- start:1 stop:666 length:666 start_codon:yes stop_codon:yes gene_type:complete
MTSQKTREFSVASARPLPVVVLADISGSMSVDGKIDALNTAVAEMISSFAELGSERIDVHVAVITFGGDAAVLHAPFASAQGLAWQPMAAAGRTPMGHAFELASGLINDRELLPSRSYRPTLVLVSDGQPNDVWTGPLENLIGSERGAKADRFAIAIGGDADFDVLRLFAGTDRGHVLQAHEARDVRKVFRWVTMTVTARTQSINPDATDLHWPDPEDMDF